MTARTGLLTPFKAYALISDVETDAYISLGSNQGDRELNLLRAVAEIGKIHGAKVTGLSPFYETSPTGGAVGQPHFFNAVLRLSTDRSVREVFEALVRIESQVFKRVRRGTCDPRSIDLDLLFYGSRIINEPDLVVPHPRLTERRFVLQPLNDIAPDLRHPALGLTMRELLSRLQTDETITLV